MLHLDMISSCERDFVKSAVSSNRRVDGRTSKDSRALRLSLGLDRGCCVASLGETKVLAQVSSEVIVPKPNRPNEGELFVNLELSPMAAPHFEAGRLGDFGVEIARLLERCVRDSHCVDLESLCIVAREKVWSLRVDVQVLNHRGNIAECASVATVAALLHFRRPDVTVVGTEVTVHDPREREPVPLHLHHYPYLMSFAFYDEGKTVLVDPSELEERIADGLLTLGVNAHYEICTLHQRGCIIGKDQVLLCSRLACVRAKAITEAIKEDIRRDQEARSKNRSVGFAATIEDEEVLATTVEPEAIQLDDEEATPRIVVPEFPKQLESTLSKVKVFLEGAGTAAIGRGGPSSWGVLQGADQGRNAEGAVRKATAPHREGTAAESGDSEEDEVVVLQSEGSHGDSGEGIDLTKAVKNDPARGWYSKNPF
uniref:Exosome complex component RRP45 n=1 Tax=Ixodes ricinus TaxID=34613 RepID=A0A131XUT3_IXORI